MYRAKTRSPHCKWPRQLPSLRRSLRVFPVLLLAVLLAAEQRRGSKRLRRRRVPAKLVIRWILCVLHAGTGSGADADPSER